MPSDPALAATEVSSDIRVHADIDPLLLDADAPAQRYERGSLLGQGGMGQVLLCRDKHVGREVAMKVVRADLETNSQHPDHMRDLRR